MSYILDALRKAERERGIAQVPTLMTVHDAQEGKPRRRSWVIAGVLLVCAVAVVWLAASFLRKTGTPVPAPSRVDAGKALPSEPVPESASAEGKSIRIPGTTAENEISRNAPAASVDSSDRPAGKPAEDGSRLTPPRENRLPPDTPAPQPKMPVQPQAKSASPPAARPATADGSQPKETTLREAVARMKITILLYDESKSERMVFIDNRKYVEGDYVDGRYLVESITLDGVVLSFQGERETLRPAVK
jgi:general secretion pathway protein B